MTAAGHPLCPKCGSTIVKTAREGGTVIKARYARLTQQRTLVLACGACGEELSVESAAPVRLVLRLRSQSGSV